MWEYHDPEWGEHSRKIYGQEYEYDLDRRTTCVCPEGSFISRIAGYIQTSKNWYEDGLDAISVQCSGDNVWEKSMGYYDKKDVWRNPENWYVTPDWGTICGISVEINEKHHFAQAYKFIYTNKRESETMGMTGKKFPGRWYKEECQKTSLTTRTLVGFTITSKTTILTFQPIWAEPTCGLGAVRITNLPQAWPRQWVRDLTNNAFIMADIEWNGGSPVYELQSAGGKYQLFRSNSIPLEWRVTGINYKEDDEGAVHNKMVLRIPFGADEFSGFCFEETSATVLAQTEGYKNSELVSLNKLPQVIGFGQPPVEYMKNIAMWTAPLSNNKIEWSMSIKNSKSNTAIEHATHQRKFSTSLGVDLGWNVGTKVGVSMQVGGELSREIGTEFRQMTTNSEGFKKTCSTDLRTIGERADFTVWIWEYTRERKYKMGTDQMLSCHSYVKSGPCQILPPNCLPPGGCNPPECLTCVSKSLELVPHDQFLETQKVRFGKELVEACFKERPKRCNPRAQNFDCCAKLPVGEKCGLGEGGCTHMDQCQEGTTCKEQEGDDHGGPRNMPICVTDHNRQIMIAPAAIPHAESSLGDGKTVKRQQKGGRSPEVAAQTGDDVEVLETDVSVVEGVSENLVDQEVLKEQKREQDDWKTNFNIEPPSNLYEAPPSKGGDIGVAESPDFDTRVQASSPSFHKHSFSVLLIFSFTLIMTLWWFFERRKSDAVKLEFPLLLENTSLP